MSIFHNHVLMAACCAWMVAQLSKLVVCLIMNKDMPGNFIFASGGMPSSHSATVCSLVYTVGYYEGVTSSLFAVTVMLAFIVMHDATNVRHETGKQGKIINDMITILEDMGKPIPLEKKFKELVGHTPAQVFVGACVGLFVGFIFTIW
ncbi:MAG: divergent PAP2 family protein [Lachnospiraceae bacterium]|nr:divergent PAP2 family protein [Candidatus Equihabitans merdae]